jgi:hypothetical protein
MQHSQLIQRRCGGRPVRGLLAGLATIGAALSLAVLPAAALAASSPTEVQTEPAEATPTGFKLQGKLNPNGAPTTYYFIYKQAGAVECEDLEGCGPETTHDGPLTGDTEQEVSPAEVTGLEPDTTYVYWLIARNAHGTAVGKRLGFTTPPATTPSEVVTEPAEVIPGGAKLKGKLNPGGLPTTYYFQYIGNNQIECVEVENCWPQTAHIGPITGDTQQEVTPIEVTGLTVGVTYRYRLVASNADGTVSGDVASFTVGSPPVVDSVSLSNLTSTDATLEAQIDTEGQSTIYQFKLRINLCPYSECIGYKDIPLPSGLLLGSFAGQTVNVDLNAVGVSLAPGVYEYALSATSAAGHVQTEWQKLVPPVLDPPSPALSTPSGTSQPAGSDTSTGDQPPAGSGGSSSSSTPGAQSHALQPKTTKLDALTNAQKLAAALRACKREPKKQQASCKKHARERYGTSGKKADGQASKGTKD